MTEPAATVEPSRPVLTAVAGGAAHGGRRAPVVRAPLRVVPASPVGELAARQAGAALGTLFAPVAASVAEAVGRRAPALLQRGTARAWAAAIVFVLAEECRLFAYDCCATPASFAQELGLTLRTVRARAAEVRAALGPLRLEVPAPDDGGDEGVLVWRWHSLRA